jgi:hypothetical protein
MLVLRFCFGPSHKAAALPGTTPTRLSTKGSLVGRSINSVKERGSHGALRSQLISWSRVRICPPEVEMCMARWITGYGALAYKTSRIE